jgi:hypothetical protein
MIIVKPALSSKNVLGEPIWETARKESPMTKNREDRSAQPGKPDAITATLFKLLAVGAVEAVPDELPKETARWWTGGQGGKLLISEIQKVIWNPPNIRREAKLWSRFYKFLFNRDVSFHVPEMELQPAENWIFVPDADPVRFEEELQSCCRKFFPAYDRKQTIGAVGGNKFREGRKYIIRVEQEDTRTCFPAIAQGTEVTLAELLARELYSYFRGARRPKSDRVYYAPGSWFEDGKVPAICWTDAGLKLFQVDRTDAGCHCLKQLQVLDE